MSYKTNKHSLINSSLMTGALLALIAAVFWYLRRRTGQTQPGSQRPVIWRRDIEMGPAAGTPGETVAEEVTIEAVPDLRAGDGGLSDEGTGEGKSEDVVMKASGTRIEEIPLEQTPDGDDLEIVEGIGPKISSILRAAGIHTFAQLATTEVSKLEEILREAGMRRINNPATWPEQARLAAAGDWDALENLQKELKGGRR